MLDNVIVPLVSPLGSSCDASEEIWQHYALLCGLQKDKWDNKER